MCDPISATIGAVASIGGGIYSSNKADKRAKQAQASADAATAKSLEQASKELQYRKGLVNDMIGSAHLSRADVEQQTGQAASSVRDSFDKIDAQERRAMMRIGVNPSSGRYAETSRKTKLARAIAEANAVNSTRTNLRTYERGAVRAARMAGLGVQDPSIGVLEQASANQTAMANASRQQAASALSAGLSTAGMAIGYGFGGGTAKTPAPNINRQALAPVQTYTPNYSMGTSLR